MPTAWKKVEQQVQSRIIEKTLKSQNIMRIIFTSKKYENLFDKKKKKKKG